MANSRRAFLALCVGTLGGCEGRTARRVVQSDGGIINYDVPIIITGALDASVAPSVLQQPDADLAVGYDAPQTAPDAAIANRRDAAARSDAAIGFPRFPDAAARSDAAVGFPRFPDAAARSDAAIGFPRFPDAARNPFLIDARNAGVRDGNRVGPPSFPGRLDAPVRRESGSLIDGIIDAALRADSNGQTAEAPLDSLVSLDVTWTGKEMLGRPSDHSVTIKAIASAAVEAYFDYGTSSGGYTMSSTPTTYANGTVEAIIGGLSTDTRYYYRMRYRAAGDTSAFLNGNEYTFNTQRAKTAGFTFAIQSDSHLGYTPFNDPSLYQVTMQNIAAAKPDFLLDLGDAVTLDDATETETTARTKYLNQRSYLEIPGHSAAIFLVLGNHEREEGWKLNDFGTDTTSSLPVLSANARKRYFVNPVPDNFYLGNTDPRTELDGDHLRGDYYAFEWGNALFVAIDPFWYTTKRPYAGPIGGETHTANEVVGTRWDWTLGQQQYLWLKQTLENSSAPLKFVFAHQMVGGIEDYGRGGARAAKYCEFGGYDTDGATYSWDTNRPGWASPIHQLFVQDHVTAYFHGHDHVYAQESLDGVTYQEVPMAASPTNDTGFSTNAAEYAGATLIANSGYLRVTVAATNATVEYVRSFRSTNNGGTNNSVAASYTLQGYTPSAADAGAGAGQ